MAAGTFGRYWFASSVGFLALATATVATDVLLVDVLEASSTELGVLRALQLAPFVVVGLVAGALVDRWRRRPTIVWTNLARAGLLALVPVLLVTGQLRLELLAVLLVALGTVTVFGLAAEQAYLPDLVPRSGLVAANAHLAQSRTVAQTSGPAIAGAGVGLVGAPLVLLGSALGHVVTALVVARTGGAEEAADRPEVPLRRQVADGLRFVYGHRVLAPLAWSTHVWFVANTAAATVFALLALRGLAVGPVAYGVVLAAGGVGGLAGALLATAVARRVGEGATVLGARALSVLAWGGLVAVPGDGVVVMVWLGLAQVVHGFAMGVEEPSESGLQQALTPRPLLGRVNAAMRTANRTAGVLGALLGGLLVGVVGYRWSLGAVVVGFALAGVLALPLRRTTLGDGPDAPSATDVTRP